ncbi:MAG: helix-turn-helix domain-containing protein [Saprospiraceae bacterium]
MKRILEQMNLKVVDIQLGEVEVLAAQQVDMQKLNTLLRAQGFELIENRQEKLVSQIKSQMLVYLEQLEFIKIKWSDYLAAKLDLNYTYLSKIFSQHEETTMEKYFIRLRIEKVKELLSYNELTLSEIAYQLGYSSPQALSNQFKTSTGMTVSAYRELEQKNRQSLDALS